MTQLILFFTVLILLCITDTRSMLHSNLKKDLIPYGILMLATAAMGFWYFSNQYRQSISYLIFQIFKIKG